MWWPNSIFKFKLKMLLKHWEVAGFKMPPPLPLASWSRVAGDKQPNLRLKMKASHKKPNGFTMIYLLSEILLPQFVSKSKFGSYSMQNWSKLPLQQRLWESWNIFPVKLGPSHRGSGAKWEPSWTCEHVWPALVPESSIVDQLNPKSSNLAVEYLSGSCQILCISGLFNYEVLTWCPVHAPMTVPVKSALQILYLLDHKKCEPGTRIIQITRLFVFDPTSFPGRKLHHWCASKWVATVLAARLPLSLYHCVVSRVLHGWGCITITSRLNYLLITSDNLLTLDQTAATMVACPENQEPGLRCIPRLWAPSARCTCERSTG